VTCVSALPLDQVVVLVNEWGTAPRLAAGEQNSPYPVLGALAEAVGDVGDEQLTAVADALYPIFAAADEDAVVRRLNEVLDQCEPHPRLARAGGVLGEAWLTDPPREILSAAALGLYRQLLEWGDARRLGTCTAANCVDVYVDSSSAGQRKFCSVQCQNRSRVAAFRARRSGT
jgi:predicted RNA-binding Zn ribbon-like protein